MKVVKPKSNATNAKTDKTDKPQITVFPQMKRPIISLGEMDDNVMDGLLDCDSKTLLHRQVRCIFQERLPSKSKLRPRPRPRPKLVSRHPLFVFLGGSLG